MNNAELAIVNYSDRYANYINSEWKNWVGSLGYNGG
jgi:hypothetical protein